MDGVVECGLFHDRWPVVRGSWEDHLYSSVKVAVPFAAPAVTWFAVW
jgi:hypothetical protein